MKLRKLRWLATAVLAAAAVFAAPARSSAATQIIVSEFNTATSTTTNSQTFTIATLPTAGAPLTFAGGNFRDISITMTTSSGAGPADFHSLTTTFGAKPTTGTFDSNIVLRLSILDDGFQNSNPDGTAMFSGNLGNSSGGSSTQVTGDTTLTATTPPTTTLGPASAAGGVGVTFTAANVSVLPANFSIAQTLELRVSAITSANASFGSTISSFVSTSPPAAVPAPPALLLALTALPLVGLRRKLRKTA